MEKGILLTENDLVFVTNGSCTEGTIYGDQNHAPNGDAEVRTSGCWSLWKNIAKQDPSFGHPEKFCSDIDKTNWESATVTTLDETHHPVYHKYLQTRPAQRQGRYRRYRKLSGFQLAIKLDNQPSGTVQGSGQG